MRSARYPESVKKPAVDLQQINQTWTNALSEHQIEVLRWLRASKCTVEAVYAAPDPLHDMPEGLVLEVLVDKHAVVKLRGTVDEIPDLFDRVVDGARTLFDFVNEPEQRH